MEQLTPPLPKINAPSLGYTNEIKPCSFVTNIKKNNFLSSIERFLDQAWLLPHTYDGRRQSVIITSILVEAASLVKKTEFSANFRHHLLTGSAQSTWSSTSCPFFEYCILNLSLKGGILLPATLIACVASPPTSSTPELIGCSCNF